MVEFAVRWSLVSGDWARGADRDQGSQVRGFAYLVVPLGSCGGIESVVPSGMPSVSEGLDLGCAGVGEQQYGE